VEYSSVVKGATLENCDDKKCSDLVPRFGKPAFHYWLFSEGIKKIAYAWHFDPDVIEVIGGERKKQRCTIIQYEVVGMDHFEGIRRVRLLMKGEFPKLGIEDSITLPFKPGLQKKKVLAIRTCFEKDEIRRECFFDCGDISFHFNSMKKSERELNVADREITRDR